jgi:hypothetical protein
LFDFDELSSSDLEHLLDIKRKNEQVEEERRVAGFLGYRVEMARAFEEHRISTLADPATTRLLEEAMQRQPVADLVEVAESARVTGPTVGNEDPRPHPGLGAFLNDQERRPPGGWPTPIPGRPWCRAALVAFAVKLAEEEWPAYEVPGWLTKIAAREGLTPDDLSDALLAWEDSQ